MTDETKPSASSFTAGQSPTQTHYLALAALEESLRLEFFPEGTTRPPKALITIVEDSRQAGGHHSRSRKWSTPDGDEVYSIPTPRGAYQDPSQVCIRVLMALNALTEGATNTYISKGTARKLHSFGIGIEKPDGDYWKRDIEVIPGGRLDLWMQSHLDLFVFCKSIPDPHVDVSKSIDDELEAPKRKKPSQEAQVAVLKHELEAKDKAVQVADERVEKAEAVREEAVRQATVTRSRIQELELENEQLKAALKDERAQAAFQKARADRLEEALANAKASKPKAAKKPKKPSAEVTAVELLESVGA